MEILKTTKLTKVYGSGDTAVTAADHIDLTINKGEFTAVVGASGSGKSTLLHLLGGVDTPTSGKVFIDGDNIYDLNDEKRSKIKVGDIIEFTNTTTLEILKVKVENIYKYNDFEQLYKKHNKISIGYQEDEVADPNDMLMYYKKEKILKYGVLAIQVIVI